MTRIGALEAGGTKMVLAVYDPASARGDDTYWPSMTGTGRNWNA